MPRKDYEKLAELWPRYADERYFLSKSNKDFVDRNLFITIRDKETTCIKPYQQDWICHMVWPWMFCLWITILKIQLSGKTGSLGIDLFTLLCSNCSRKAWRTYEMGESHFTRFDAKISPLSYLEKS